MFGPIRGAWLDMNILTHYARPPFHMEGNTTFHFVAGGIHEALDRARAAANGWDVRIGGGPNTIQQYLRAGIVDELHAAIAPVLLGAGERLVRGSTFGLEQPTGDDMHTQRLLEAATFRRYEPSRSSISCGASSNEVAHLPRPTPPPTASVTPAARRRAPVMTGRTRP